MSLRNAPVKKSRSADLDQRYGKIGISAVAAAIRYQSEARNPKYAPASPPPDDEDSDAT